VIRRLMCHSPDAAAVDSKIEASGCADDAEDTSPKQFSFGTTHPLQLPAVPPELRSPASPSKSPSKSPAADADAQAIDDEFTFGTTKPVNLPDLSHIPKDGLQTGKSPASPSVECVTPKSSPTTTLAVTASPSVRSWRSPDMYHGNHHNLNHHYHGQSYDSTEVVGHWSPEGNSHYLPSQVAVQSPWPAFAVMQSAYGYSPPIAAMVLANDLWSKPSPIEASPEQWQFSTNQAKVATVRENCIMDGTTDDVAAPDLEAGDDDDVIGSTSSLAIPELASRSSWSLKTEAMCGASPARRIASVVCILLSLICIVALVVFVCVDSGGS